MTNRSGYEKPFNQGEKLIKPLISHYHLFAMKGKYVLLFTFFQAMKKTDVFHDQRDRTSSRSGFFLRLTKINDLTATLLKALSHPVCYRAVIHV